MYHLLVNPCLRDSFLGAQPKTVAFSYLDAVSPRGIPYPGSIYENVEVFVHKSSYLTVYVCDYSSDWK